MPITPAQAGVSGNSWGDLLHQIPACAGMIAFKLLPPDQRIGVEALLAGGIQHALDGWLCRDFLAGEDVRDICHRGEAGEGGRIVGLQREDPVVALRRRAPSRGRT